MSPSNVVWPNFFVVGAVKCGTTSIWAHLRQHPQVFVPAVKEPHFFADCVAPVPKAVAHQHCPGDVERYQRLYQGAEKYAAIGDLSPSYLWDEDAPAKIHKVSPQAKIVIMLRDPVDRAFSHYLLKVQEGAERRPFLKAVQEDYALKQKGWWISNLYVELGLYTAQVRRYMEIFGEDQVKVFLFDDLNRNPEDLFSRLCQFIGIDPALVEKSELEKVHNPYKVPRSRVFFGVASFLGPKIRHMLLPASLRWRLYNSSLLFDMKKPRQTDESKRFLQGLYEPEMTRLEQLMDRKLPELRKSWI